MATGCGDVLTLEDLKTAKLHQLFEAEVITGRQGGVAGGVAIDFATNQVTGQVQKTLPAILRDAGFRPAAFTFKTGGTLLTSNTDVAVLWPVSSGGDGNYYIWKGAYPKTIPANSTPASSGGISSSGWMPLGDVALRSDLISSDVTKGDALIRVKQPGANSTVRTQHDKNTDSISVKDYGALGNGTTDDSDAFQAAHDSLGNEGGIITVPGGAFWRIEKVINVTKPVTFIGSGSTASTLTRSTNASSTFFNIAAEGCALENLRLLGKGANDSTPGTFAIETTNAATRFYVRNVQALFVHSGLALRSNLFTVDKLEARDINSPSGVGIEVDQYGVIDGVGVIGNSIVQNGDATEPYAGINFKHAIGILVHNSQLMQCGNSMVMAPPTGRTVTSIKVVNCYFDTSDNGGLLINNSEAGNIQRITIGDSWLSSCRSGAGVRIVSGSNIDGLRIANCELYDSVNGIQIDDDTTIQNLDIDACVFAGNTSADISIGKASENITIRNCRTGTAGGFVGSPNGIFINAGTKNLTIENSTIHKMMDLSYPSTGVVLRNITGQLTGSTTFDPASIANNTGITSTCACAGARMGDLASASFSLNLQGLSMTAWVSANDIVSVRLFNSTGGTIDLSPGNLLVKVERIS